MIPTLIREKLREVIGYHYTNEVLEILKEKNVVSRSGKPYGASMIRNVMNGLNQNEYIENAIWELAKRKIESKEKNNRATKVVAEVT